MSIPPYETWSREDLIARLKHLDSTLQSSRTHTTSKQGTVRRTKSAKAFDFSAHPRRKIALKFCYAGWEYNGLAFQKDKTPLPTVEGTLYNALASCRLIDPDTGPEGCDWERCGRTDRGVSSAGQVVSLWVRSNLHQEIAAGPSTSSEHRIEDSLSQQTAEEESFNEGESDLPLLEFDPSDVQNTNFASSVSPHNNLRGELRYVSLLNRVLPPTIRIIAWSPVAPSFSSRFSCKQRHYKYFFTSDGLDITAMQDAAERLVGEHDFRNLCKLDPSKQITSFKRKIIRAEISPISVFNDKGADSSAPSALTTSRKDDNVFVFDLVGTAFLYHQVRHIMAILFLIGSGLEHPSVVTSLINADRTTPYAPFRDGEAAPEIVDCKPEYQMADGLPLMLWNCGYSEDDVSWQTDASGVDEDATEADGATLVGGSNLYHQMHAIHSRSLIHTTLDAHFLRAVSAYHSPPTDPFPLSLPHAQDLPADLVLSIPLGGGTFRRGAARTYVPLLQRKRLESVEAVNQRWLKTKGARRQKMESECVGDE